MIRTRNTSSAGSAVVSLRSGRARITLLAVTALGMFVAGCSSSTDEDATAKSSTTSAPSTTEAKPPPKFVVLLTNDDGIGAPGIDVMAQALTKLSGIELVVSAPAANQSGTADKTTPGTLKASDSKTVSGIAGTAVEGFPADSVKHALDAGVKPNLVISGINFGQNISVAVELSGTIGAARTAARAGIPALAVSQGIANEPDYPAAAQLVMDWLAEHRAALADGTEAVAVTSINVPTCAPTDLLKELVEVPVAADLAGRDMLNAKCDSTVTAPKDDVDAFISGYPTISNIEF